MRIDLSSDAMDALRNLDFSLAKILTAIQLQTLILEKSLIQLRDANAMNKDLLDDIYKARGMKYEPR